MTIANRAALEFLLSRRSRPARTLALPVPTQEQVGELLTAATRVPDHGKLEPWRFLVLARPGTDRLARLVEERGQALGVEPERIAKSASQYSMADLAIVVVQVPRPTEKVPLIEQTYSTGAVLMQLLNAATAAGWGANLLTGWPVYDETFRQEGLGLAPGETVAGIVHIGTPTAETPDRPRPDLSRLVTWVTA
ncbi:Nitroreductase family protein [Rubellimicrobium mesophilum DSM 19309]|uniref:Putative NAD(P)H nitroreductase n=1 Tax=Rubellimicrobium mesophilum DSM 19309 TaxID=442562 RepID=A0A017HTB6_9RHOB|nr:nitroreductase [Rubellimicrobium mesophilum]EYD77621.1 Nitroreductase family protein [Rubellimicrobium mesophilum DSM 19309]